MRLIRDAVAATLEAFTPITAAPSEHRAAAVAITLVTGDNGETAFLLTRRSAKLRAHRGQWALPGGRLEPGEDAGTGARRELHEELAVAVPPEEVLGVLDDYVTRSGYRITPVVVWAIDPGHAVTPSAAEVASVHTIPIREIDVEPRFITIPESSRPVIQVPLRDSLIHAPTGAILHQFREVVLHGRPTRVVDYEQPVFAWR